MYYTVEYPGCQAYKIVGSFVLRVLGRFVSNVPGRAEPCRFGFGFAILSHFPVSNPACFAGGTTLRTRRYLRARSMITPRCGLGTFGDFWGFLAPLSGVKSTVALRRP